MHLHLETYLYFSDGSFLNQSSLNITHSSVYIIHHTKNTFCSHNKQLKKIAPLLSRTSPYHSLTLHNNLAVNISSSEQFPLITCRYKHVWVSSVFGFVAEFHHFHSCIDFSTEAISKLWIRIRQLVNATATCTIVRVPECLHFVKYLNVKRQW